MFKASLKLLSAFIFYVSTIIKSKGWLSYFDVSFNEEIQKSGLCESMWVTIF